MENLKAKDSLNIKKSQPTYEWAVSIGKVLRKARVGCSEKNS